MPIVLPRLSFRLVPSIVVLRSLQQHGWGSLSTDEPWKLSQSSMASAASDIGACLQA